MAEEKARKYTFTTKMFECCGDDELRPLMQCVHFLNGYAYATNGYVSIKQTLELQSIMNKENLDGKSLHKKSYQAIMGFEIAECNLDGIYCKNTTGQTAFFDYFNRNDEPIPNFEKAMQPKRGLTSLSFIGINPEHLARLSKAIYNPGNNLRMQFTGIDSQVLVDAIGVEGQTATIMPQMLNDSLFS